MNRPYVHKPMPELAGLWVIAVVSNPQRYRSRYELYHRFAARVAHAGAQLLTVECAFGDRPFELTEPGRRDHVQLRSAHEIWLKESMINAGIARLPSDWRYVAWVDADVEFVRQDWPAEVVHQLQHYHVLQLFRTAVDMGPDGEALATHTGFMAAWQSGKLPPPNNAYYQYQLGHPGFAWAARREAIDDLGGLIDFAVLGSGDHHMAWALVGAAADHAPATLTPAYRAHLARWQGRASRHVRRNVGHMPGTILHHWHGAKRHRRYRERWTILRDHRYDPDLDLQRDWQGLIRLSDRGLRMRNDLRDYFRQRSEDSIDL